MISKVFAATVNWPLSDTTQVIKTHKVCFKSKPNLMVSADATFKGDATKYNPEDLFLSALASCHFMSYQYLCKIHNITICKYTDTVKGQLKVNANGSGSFTKITLNPVVHILNSSNITLANQLHHKAHQLCFIANSISVPIQIQPKISIKS